MNRQGVVYDVGRVLNGINWHPDYDPKIVHRELEIIKNDLHCNAVKIHGRDVNRLIATARDALQQGLEVLIAPELWDKSPTATISYTVAAATAAEPLHRDWPGKVTLSVGTELSIFMKGILPGRSYSRRVRGLSPVDFRSGRYTAPLNRYLAEVLNGVRPVFNGSLTYSSLAVENVDWEPFDFVGIDHYWDDFLKDRYRDRLDMLRSTGKPVLVTEFGFRTYEDARLACVTGQEQVNYTTVFLHQLPVIGKAIRPRLKRVFKRDEDAQASRLISQLELLDKAGVDGAFVFNFAFQLNTYSDEPKYDLDRSSYSLVKSYAHGGRGVTYPDMTWEPKESFRAVADYYAKHGPQGQVSR